MDDRLLISQYSFDFNYPSDVARALNLIAYLHPMFYKLTISGDDGSYSEILQSTEQRIVVTDPKVDAQPDHRYVKAIKAFADQGDVTLVISYPSNISSLVVPLTYWAPVETMIGDLAQPKPLLEDKVFHGIQHWSECRYDHAPERALRFQEALDYPTFLQLIFNVGRKLRDFHVTFTGPTCAICTGVLPGSMFRPWRCVSITPTGMHTNDWDTCYIDLDDGVVDDRQAPIAAQEDAFRPPLWFTEWKTWSQGQPPETRTALSMTNWMARASLEAVKERLAEHIVYVGKGEVPPLPASAEAPPPVAAVEADGGVPLRAVCVTELAPTLAERI